MSFKDRTKQMFADTLREMIKTRSLEKIFVKDICRLCGVDRQTFYYHFKDKYDLAAWIFVKDYEASLSDTDGKYIVEHVAGFLKRVKSDESFYKKAFSDRSQNAVSRYIYTYFVDLGIRMTCNYLGCSRLPKEIVYAIKSHSFACVGHTTEWLDGRADYTPAEFASLQYTFMPDILKQAYGISG